MGRVWLSWTTWLLAMGEVSPQPPALWHSSSVARSCSLFQELSSLCRTGPYTTGVQLVHGGERSTWGACAQGSILALPFLPAALHQPQLLPHARVCKEGLKPVASFSLEKAKRKPSAVFHWSKRIYREDRDRQFPEGKRKNEKQQAQAVTKEIMVGVKEKICHGKHG